MAEDPTAARDGDGGGSPVVGQLSFFFSRWRTSSGMRVVRHFRYSGVRTRRRTPPTIRHLIMPANFGDDRARRLITGGRLFFFVTRRVSVQERQGEAELSVAVVDLLERITARLLASRVLQSSLPRQPAYERPRY